MKKLTLFLWLLILSLGVNAQTYLSVLNKQMKDIIQANSTGNYALLAKHSYYKMITTIGSEDKLKDLFTTKMNEAKEAGLTIDSVVVSQPIQTIKTAKTIQYVLPMNTYMKTKSGSILNKGFMLGISFDNGKFWQFIDMHGMAEATFRKFVTELSTEIIIPEIIEPVDL